VGAPPDPEEQFQALKEKAQQKIKEVPVKKIVTGLSALIAVWLVWRLLFGAPEPLEQAAREAAQALANNDQASLRWIAVPGTAEDVDRWFDETSRRLAETRAKWHGKDEVVEVHVGQEDRAQRKGAVAVSIHPGVVSGGLDTSLADPSAATAGADPPFDVEMDWVLGRWGRWKLDGRETYAKAHPTP